MIGPIVYVYAHSPNKGPPEIREARAAVADANCPLDELPYQPIGVGAGRTSAPGLISGGSRRTPSIRSVELVVEVIHYEHQRCPSHRSAISAV